MTNKFVRVHYIVATIVFLTGLLNILSSLSLHHIPHIKLFEGIIPLYFKHTARTFTLLIGFFLLFLSLNLFKRKRRAWILTVILISISIILHFIRGFQLTEMLFLYGLLFILFATQHVFEVESKKDIGSGIKRFFFGLVLLFVYAIFGFYLFQGQFSNAITLQHIFADYLYSITGIGQEVLVPLTRNANWFADSISIVSTTLFVFSIFSLFQPLTDRYAITETEREALRYLILTQGENPISYFALMNDKNYFINYEKTSCIAYKIKNGMAIALGDPIGGDSTTKQNCVHEFLKHNAKNDLKTVFFNTSHQTKQIYEDEGYKHMKFGEEAVIKTTEFTLLGSAMSNVRYEVNKMSKLGIQFEWFTLNEIPWKYVNTINALHESWTKQKKSPKLTFSLDYFPFPIEPNAHALIIKNSTNEVSGILTFFPYKDGMLLDFMIRSESAPGGIIEAGLNEAISYFKSHGITYLSLGVAPLADVDLDVDKDTKEQLKKIVFERFNQFYQYKSLFKFKAKFHPQWEHKYIVYKNDIDLPSIMLAIVQAHLKDPFSLKSLLV
jgi:phosphatidylglycerol lysyltransferase